MLFAANRRGAHVQIIGLGQRVRDHGGVAGAAVGLLGEGAALLCHAEAQPAGWDAVLRIVTE